MRVLRIWSGLVVVATGCGGAPAVVPVDGDIDASPVDAAPDGAVDALVDVPVDAAPVLHVGGWRMAGSDAAASHHVGVVGPPAAATNRLFHEEPDRKLSAPIIDENGNLYFTSFLTSRTFDLVSLDRAGVERWRTFLPGGSSLSDLTLAPNGDLVAVSSVGSFPDAPVVRLTTFDAATGESHPGAMLVSDFPEPMKVGPDGRVFVQTHAQDDVRLEMHPSPTAPPRWTRSSSGGSFAIAPAGDALVCVEAGALNTRPFAVVGVDPATGVERWRKPLPAQLTQGPGLAIDRDGAAYVAVATGSREMHVFKFSQSGEMLWEAQNTEDFPTQVLLGADTVIVSAHFSFALRKSDGSPAADSPCGVAMATDGADRVYSACNFGTQVIDALGNVVAEWRGSPEALAIAPDGAIFYWPYLTTHWSQLFRIQ